MATVQPFIETQRFKQVWLWLLLGGILGVIIIGMLYEGDFNIKDFSWDAIIPIIIVLAVIWLLASMRLMTRLDEHGVNYRFAPFHRKERFIPWHAIAQVYVRQYNPIGEYGGWGIRGGLGRSGDAYNTMGNMGLQLVLKDGKRLLLGTQKPEEVQATLDALRKAGVLSRDETAS